MKAELCSEFEEDMFMERLIKLRKSDPATYLTYPQAIRDVVEEYQHERETARLRSSGKGLEQSAKANEELHADSETG
jgi:hypothetical protein